MKKAAFALAVGDLLGVLAGGVLIWTLVLPFIGMVFQSMWFCVTSLL